MSLPGLEKKPSPLESLLSNDTARKAALLIIVSLFTTVLFFPFLTFRGYSYQPDDVAVMDIKSPVEVDLPGARIRKGETIVRDGQIVTVEDLVKFGLIEEAVRDNRSVIPALGFFAFALFFFLSVYYFASRNIRKFTSSFKDLLLMAAVFAGVVFLFRLSDTVTLVMKEVLSGPPSLYKYIIPAAIGPMLVRLLLNSETALVFASVSSVLAGFFIGGSVEVAAYTLIGGLVGAMGVKHCTHRSIVIKAGMVLGFVNSALIMAIFALKSGGAVPDVPAILFVGLANGMVTAILAIGIAPALETAFQYTTNIKLLELSRMDHPLLKELAMRAPGTYHHSIVIGTLVEAAAEAINANPLLARVAAYYHDIGKLKMPAYFIENISEENRHDKLTPSMSSLILTNHIKEGVELARKYRLGAEITDIISQHHGTALITYFYQKAKSQESPELDGVDESDFRYPGPKPQTKEAGLVMLADAIEAASKTISDPTPDKIQWLTQKIVNKIFSDGQLDECELTLKDLHYITKSFNRVFAGVYHQRIDYPEPVEILKEKEIEGAGAGQNRRKGADENKKDGRGRLKRLGV